jgi:hypothetical protein
MKYEYKIIALCEADVWLIPTDLEKLNKWFETGWEYVDSVQQRIAGSPLQGLKPVVGIVLRKRKITDPFNNG